MKKLFLVALAAFFLAGCASIPRQRPEAEVKLVEANSALDSVNEMSAPFYAQLGKVIEEVKQFCGRPGWTEFEQVLLEYPTLKDADNQIDITPEIEANLSGWALRWNASWEETLTGYHDLVDKCIIVEARKLALRERILAVQAKYLAAVMLELSAGREQQGKEIYSVVEVLDKSGAELLSYEVDDLGLYRFR